MKVPVDNYYFIMEKRKSYIKVYLSDFESKFLEYEISKDDDMTRSGYLRSLLQEEILVKAFKEDGGLTGRMLDDEEQRNAERI